MRKIRVISTEGSIRNIETSATNLGELKSVLREQGYSLINTKYIEASTKSELLVDDSVLPQEDFKLYLVTSNPKSGILESTIWDKLNSIESKIDTLLIGKNPTVFEKIYVSEEDKKDLNELKELESLFNSNVKSTHYYDNEDEYNDEE